MRQDDLVSIRPGDTPRPPAAAEPLAWGDNGASVWRLDDTLGERLAACDEETLARCAEELAVCEAFESESWAEEEILSLLFALRELAESAEDEASTFFVWLCAC